MQYLFQINLFGTLDGKGLETDTVFYPERGYARYFDSELIRVCEKYVQ